MRHQAYRRAWPGMGTGPPPRVCCPDYVLCRERYDNARARRLLCPATNPLESAILRNMPVLKLRVYPDPVLTKVAEPVTDFGPRVAQIVEEMFLTMYQEHGLGLAAPQVGISKRIYVINTEPEQPPEGELALINPEVVHVEGEQFSEEGCLSFPGLYAKKLRPNKVTM